MAARTGPDERFVTTTRDGVRREVRRIGACVEYVQGRTVESAMTHEDEEEARRGFFCAVAGALELMRPGTIIGGKLQPEAGPEPVYALYQWVGDESRVAS